MLIWAVDTEKGVKMALSAAIAGAAVGASLLDSLLQNSANSKNYKAQKEILEWQKEAQERRGVARMML